MNLYYWTEREYDTCNHHAVFAENEDEAKAIVIESIHKWWELLKDEDENWIKRQAQSEINSFLNDPKWTLTVHEVKPGVVSFSSL